MDKTVFMLHHVHEFENGHEDVKLIGVFSTREKAESALAKVKDMPGFKELPQGFSLDEHTLDQLGWVEGHFTTH